MAVGHLIVHFFLALPSVQSGQALRMAFVAWQVVGPRRLYHRYHRPSSQHRMDIPNLEVVTLSGKRLSLKEDLQEAVRFLEEGGCLVLKGATDLSPRRIDTINEQTICGRC